MSYIVFVADNRAVRTLLSRARARSDIHSPVSGEGLCRAAAAAPMTHIILDPSLLRPDLLPALIATLHARSGHLLLYCTPTRSCFAVIAAIARQSFAEVVFAGVDDLEVVRSRIIWLDEGSPQALTLSRLSDQLVSIPDAIRGPIIGLFSNQPLPLTVESLVGGGKTARRRFERWIRRAGFSSAADIIRAALVVRAWESLVDTSGNLGVAAHRAGYRSAATMLAHFKRVTRMPPIRAWRSMLADEVAAAAFATMTNDRFIRTTVSEQPEELTRQPVSADQLPRGFLRANL